ncbi:proline racemase family protein [Kribbella sp. CWNU-51]
MTELTSAKFVAEGTSEGQPVACYDLTPPEHNEAAELARWLELIRVDYFETRGSDPSAIVAVVVAPSTSCADYGLRFVAAAGPLGGCGEATLFATYACTNPDVYPSVTFETSGGQIVGSNLGSGRIAIQMPAVVPASVVQQVEYEDEFLRIRSVTAGGNRFAAVSADDLGIRFEQSSLDELTVTGSDLLRWLRRHASTSSELQAPDMLLITEPVAGSSTRSAVIWGDSVLNRGPCGTGTCVRYVLAVEDDDVRPGSHLVHESLFGYSFEAHSIAEGADSTTDGLNIVLSGVVEMV